MNLKYDKNGSHSRLSDFHWETPTKRPEFDILINEKKSGLQAFLIYNLFPALSLIFRKTFFEIYTPFEEPLDVDENEDELIEIRNLSYKFDPTIYVM